MKGMRLMKGLLLEKKNSLKRGLKNNKGFTLIEVVMVILLLGMVLACIYLFYNFSVVSWNRTKSENYMIQDTGLLLTRMEREFRQAQKVGFNAVEIFDEGNEVIIYTYEDKTDLMVGYRIKDGKLERATSTDFNTPVLDLVWETVIPSVAKSKDESNIEIPYFKIVDLTRIEFNISVFDPDGHVEDPITISDTFTVRSKGAM